MKYLKKSQAISLASYYTNLIGRAIYTYNSKETSYMMEGEQLLIFKSLKDISLVEAKAPCSVVVLIGGGALPNRVGSWVCKHQLIGSLYSLAVYEKKSP